MQRKMKITLVILCAVIMPLLCRAQKDSLQVQKPIREVVVTGSRHHSDVRHAPLSISVIPHSKIEQQHNSSLLHTIARQVPSLFITSRSNMGYGVSTGAAGGMSMRGIGGSPTTALLITIDGVPQYMGLMGHPIADICHSAMAESVEVLRGPSSVLYGSNAMGGVINIVTRKMQQDGVEDDIELSYGSFNTLQSSLTNRVRRGRFSSSAGAIYNYTDGHRANLRFEQAGGNLSLAYSLSSHWDISLSGQVTHFNASNPGSIYDPIIDNDSRITRYGSTLSVKNQYDTSSGAINIFYNGGRHRINDGYAPDEQPLDYRFNSRDEMMGVAIYQRITLLRSTSITLGFDYQHFGGKAWNRYLGDWSYSLTANRAADELAGYITARQSIARQLILDAGIRLDHHSRTGSEWIPQASITYMFNHGVVLKAMASKGFRFPTIREMYMFPPQNPDLKPESIASYELSLAQTLREGRVRYGVNLYYIDGKNMIRTQPVDGRPLNINTGAVENWGVECQVSWLPFRHWQVEANYSFLDMKYPVVAAPKHKAYLSIGFSKGRFAVNSSVQYIGGLIIQSSPLLTEHNIVLWDAGIDFRLLNIMSVFLRADNLLAQRYQINAGYPMPGATFKAGVKFKF